MNDKKREKEKRGPPFAKATDGKNGEEGKESGIRNLESETSDIATSGPGADTPPDASPHPLEGLFDEYPLRDPSEDPVWSVRIVRGWLYFLAFNFAWIILFLILGIFYE